MGKFSRETRERAVRLVLALEQEVASRREALESVAAVLGCSTRQLSSWMSQHDTFKSSTGQALVDINVYGAAAAPGRGTKEVKPVSGEHVDAERFEVLRAELASSLRKVDWLLAKSQAQEDQLKRIELYLLYMMRHSGLEVDDLRTPRPDSQLPSTSGDIGFVKLDITSRSILGCIQKIRNLDVDKCRNSQYIETILLPELGLSEEDWSFPKEVAHLSGKGLHLLQLPCQVAPFLAWLTDHARGIETYLEIGVRWGGMFILLTEWLRRFSPEFRRATALDPSDISPLIREYKRLEKENGAAKIIELDYIQQYSNSEIARRAVLDLNPDFVFIDGDHSKAGVTHDYELIKDCAKMVMFHDICAPNWPGVGQVWRRVLRETRRTHLRAEFTQQYQTGDGGGMGIGVIRRLEASPEM